MTCKVQVSVACDAGRVLSCHLHVDVVGGHVQDAMLTARLDAEDAGWSQEQHAAALLDVCPACTMAYEAGIRGVGLRLPPCVFPPDAPLPRTVAEAVSWDRWRELQEAKRQGQR
jgi:hypothetical protein